MLNSGLALMNEDRGPGETNKKGPTFVEGALATAIGYARNKEEESNTQVVLRVEINGDNFPKWQPFLYKVRYPNHGNDFLPNLIFSQGQIIVTNKEILPINDFHELHGEIQIEMDSLPQDLEDEIHIAILADTDEVNFIRFGELRGRADEFKLK